MDWSDENMEEMKISRPEMIAFESVELNGEDKNQMKWLILKSLYSPDNQVAPISLTPSLRQKIGLEFFLHILQVRPTSIIFQKFTEISALCTAISDLGQDT